MARNKEEYNIAPVEDTGEVTTILASGATLEGNLNVPGGIRVDGKMKGEIFSTGTVIIGKDGILEGTIKANNVIIGGKYIGKLLAKERLIIEASANVTGELQAKRLAIGEGATFEGSFTMKDKTTA
jgi:cytoskeletal protein CcmA (bactofilin family)